MAGPSRADEGAARRKGGDLSRVLEPNAADEIRRATSVSALLLSAAIMKALRDLESEWAKAMNERDLFNIFDSGSRQRDPSLEALPRVAKVHLITARRAPGRIVALLAGLAVAGCALAISGQPEPPPQIHPINPDTEWSEIKASRAAGQTSTCSLEVRPTLERSVWGEQHLASVRVRVLPYASGLWEDLSNLLRWRYKAGPYYRAKVRDAPQLVNETLARYRTALAAVGLDDVAQDLTVEPNRHISLALAAGEYLVLSEAECCSAPMHKVWVWLLRVRLERQATAVVLLEDASRFCSEAWTRSDTRCREPGDSPYGR